MENWTQEIKEDGTIIYHNPNAAEILAREPDPVEEAIIPTAEDDLIGLRLERDRRLKMCDWTQLPDNTLTSEQRNAWMLFRTELRNITDGLTTVEQVKNVDYPDKPNG